MTKTEHKHEAPKEDPRELLYQYRNLESQFSSIINEARKIENSILEFNLAIEAINNIEKTPGSDILVPLGANAFAYAKLSDSKDILTGIGSDILVKKTAKESVELVKKNLENLQKNLDALNAVAKRVEDKLIELTPKIQPYINE